MSLLCCQEFFNGRRDLTAMYSLLDLPDAAWALVYEYISEVGSTELCSLELVNRAVLGKGFYRCITIKATLRHDQNPGDISVWRWLGRRHQRLANLTLDLYVAPCPLASVPQAWGACMHLLEGIPSLSLRVTMGALSLRDPSLHWILGYAQLVSHLEVGQTLDYAATRECWQSILSRLALIPSLHLEITALPACSQLNDLRTLSSSLCDLVLGSPPGSTAPQQPAYQDWPALAALTKLTSLVCSDLGLTHGEAWPAICNLKGLSVLELRGCELGNPPTLSGLRDLSTLILPHSPLTTCQPLSHLTKLRNLELDSSEQLSSLISLQPLTALSSLQLQHCRRLQDLNPLSTLPSLQLLHLSYCSRVSTLPPFISGNIKTLMLSCCTTLTAASIEPHLSTLPHLRHLDISGISSIATLQPLAGSPTLTCLRADPCYLQALVELPSLCSFSCAFSNISDLTPLTAASSSLTHLKLLGARRVTSLDPVTRLTKLMQLELHGCGFTSLAPLRFCTQLEYLDVSNTAPQDAVLDLSGYTALRHVDVGNTRGLRSVKMPGGATISLAH